MNYKCCFLTESPFTGKYPRNFENCRTEIAWQIALNADHIPIWEYNSVKGYDFVFIIIPKAHYAIGTDGVPLNIELPNNELYKNIMNGRINFLSTLRQNNGKIFYVQEGPHDLIQNYPIELQFAHYDFISNCNAVFCHNNIDINYYETIFGKKTNKIPTLLIEDSIKDLKIKSYKEKDESIMLNGNFTKWYGVFPSFVIATKFDLKISTFKSGCSQLHEDSIENLKIYDWMNWKQWMYTLNNYKYSISLMKTYAAGTFNLNSAYLGIPCIGIDKYDTQFYINSSKLSVHEENYDKAEIILNRLINDREFYEYCSIKQKEMFFRSNSYEPNWLKYINEKLEIL